MTPEELAQQLQALVDASAAQSGQATSQLQADLDNQLTSRDAVNADILGQLQQNFATSQDVLSGLAPATSGFQNFVDAATGSNFSRSAEALANQRALIAGGQDPVSKAFTQQFAREAEIEQANNITPGQALNAQVQIANQQRADEKSSLQAQLDIAKAQRQAEKDALAAELNARKEARAERESNARIAQGNERNRIASTRTTGSGGNSEIDDLKLEERRIKLRNLKAKEFEVPKSDRDTIDEQSNLLVGLRGVADLFDSDEAKEALSNRGFAAGIAEGVLGEGAQRLPIVGEGVRNRTVVKGELDTAVQQIGLLLEGGKLAEGDIKRYSKLLPNVKDTREVALGKLQNLIKVMERDRAVNVERQRSRGKDVSIFDSDLEAQGSSTSQTTQPTTPAAPAPISNAEADEFDSIN